MSEQILYLVARLRCKWTIFARRFSTDISKPPWKLLFFGTDAFALAHLQALLDNKRLSTRGKVVDHVEVVCPTDKIFTRTKGKKVDKNAVVRNYCQKESIRIHDWPGGIESLLFKHSNQFDIGIVVSFGYLIPTSVINIFKCGVINIHPSLLPRWRGAAPIIHTLLNKDKETGISVVQLSENKFDRGNILYQEKMQIPDKTTHSDLLQSLASKGSTILIHCLENFMELKKNAWPQGSKGKSISNKVCSKDGYIDWNVHTCEDIHVLWCALATVVGVRTQWENMNVKLVKILINEKIPEKISKLLETSKPGAPFYDRERKILYIRCKYGCIAVTELHFEYQNIISAHVFAQKYLIDRKTNATKETCFVNIKS